MRESHVQYYVWHRVRKILKGPFQVVSQPRWKQDLFVKLTRDCYPDDDPLKSDPAWIGGTLEEILRTPDVDRIDVAFALGVRKES